MGPMKRGDSVKARESEAFADDGLRVSVMRPPTYRMGY